MKYKLLIISVVVMLTISCNWIVFNKSQEKVNVITNNQSENPKNVEATPISQAKVKWIPATYRGLKLGESSYEDVKKLFGEPRWEGGNEDKAFESDPEFEILLQYSNQGIGKETADIIIGRKTKIVKAISFLPYPEMTRQEAIAKFGSDYFEIDSVDSLCIEDNLKRGSSEKKLNYPILLVYPEKGMYVSIREDNTIIHIGFSYKCAD